MAHDIEESKSAIISSLTRVKRASFCTGAVASVGDDSGLAAPLRGRRRSRGRRGSRETVNRGRLGRLDRDDIESTLSVPEEGKHRHVVLRKAGHRRGGRGDRRLRDAAVLGTGLQRLHRVGAEGEGRQGRTGADDRSPVRTRARDHPAVARIHSGQAAKELRRLGRIGWQAHRLDELVDSQAVRIQGAHLLRRDPHAFGAPMLGPAKYTATYGFRAATATTGTPVGTSWAIGSRCAVSVFGSAWRAFPCSGRGGRSGGVLVCDAPAGRCLAGPWRAWKGRRDRRQRGRGSRRNLRYATDPGSGCAASAAWPFAMTFSTPAA